jgi:hypothetical protein
MAVRREATPDSATTQAVLVGPVVLAGGYGTTNLSSMPTLNPATIAPTTTALEFTASASTGTVRLIPFFRMHGQRYTVYWTVGTIQPLPAFVAHYRFDETSGTVAADATGNGRTASLAGGATWTTGRTGGAVNLDGANGHVSVPANILNGATAFTVAAWVRIDTLATWSRVFDFGSGTGSYLFLTPRSSSGTARFAITASGAGAEQRINAPAALPTGAWTHVAVTATGSLGVLYVNGVEVARNAALTLRPGASSSNWIGRSQYAGDPYLDAAVDSLRVYSRALSATEIATLHGEGS